MNDIRKMAMFRIHEFIEYDMISGGAIIDLSDC